ncbi:MAG: hypothetical protein LBP31_03595, partial [Holosporales bacterium]|nr:hypothetical protein [Holosporales bacterium]
MKIIENIILFLSLCICNINASEKTRQKYLDEAHVFFDVQNSESGLLITGREQGAEKLHISSTDFATEYTSGNFHLTKLQDGIKFQYRSDNEIFDLLVRENGDISLLQVEDEYTGWDTGKTYAIRTPGILENRGSHSFYMLVIVASEIHNYGTIQSNGISFSKSYMFNSGVLQLGDTPTGIADLTAGLDMDRTARPSFKKGIIENYGIFNTKRRIYANGGQHYHEYGSGDFEDLEMYGGDVSVNSEKMISISGNITGQVGSLSIGNRGVFAANNVGFSELQNLNIGDHGKFHSPNSYNLNIKGSFTNSGEMTSLRDINLHLKNHPLAKQSGIVFAKGTLNYSHERSDRPRNSTNAPKITSDPASRRYLMSHPGTDLNGPDFKRLKENFYRKKGYNPEADNSDSINPVRILAKKIKQTIYTDHYLNTITYHYTTTKYPDGHSSTVLTDVTETGYIWQKRTQETSEFTIPISADMEQMLDDRDRNITNVRDSGRAKIELAKELSKFLDAIYKANVYQEFLNATTQSLKEAGADVQDIQAVL